MYMDDLRQLGPRLLVLFDGYCGFCNGTVRWLVRRDRRNHLRFAPASDPRVAALLARNGLTANPGSIVAVRNAGAPGEQVLLRTPASLAILAELSQPWPAVAALMRLVPAPLREFGYSIVARLRYRLAGRLQTCPLPTAAERAHFL